MLNSHATPPRGSCKELARFGRQGLSDGTVGTHPTTQQRAVRVHKPGFTPAAELTNDITIITDPKSLHESDLADESHEPSCYKCGKQGIQLWRKSIFFDWYNNPDILCISCIAPHVVLSWSEIRETLSGSSWHPAILNSDGTRFEAVTTIRGSQYMKEKFLALPK
jgi:hypothetical protein